MNTQLSVWYFHLKCGRRNEKRYGSLIKCMSITESLSTDSCIFAICRFISRKGLFLKMMSDNETNLKALGKEPRNYFIELDSDFFCHRKWWQKKCIGCTFHQLLSIWMELKEVG